jgi:hypothetical protein
MLVLAVTLGLALGQAPVGQAPIRVTLGDVRAIYLAGYEQLLGPDRQVADCLKEKLSALGPFTFAESKDAADAILTWTSNFPSGSSRVLWGRSPQVKATLTRTDGSVLWKGDNKYKKGTTVWGASTDVPCGLANGLANKLVKDIANARRLTQH